MPTKQAMTSKESKGTTKTSRKKYKKDRKTGNSKTASQKEARKKRDAGPMSKKGATSNSKRQTEKRSESKTGKDAKGRTRKEQKKMQKAEKKANKRPLRRIFPIWLRLIVIPLLCVAALLLGMMFGYGIIGDGNPKDALDMETWQHIIDIVRKK